MREYRFDVVRVVCMTYLVMYVHLYGYIYPQGRMTFYQPVSIAMAHACLGLFTFVSGYLLGKKYLFGQHGNSDICAFYKKRILRIIPLFVIASIALWLIGFNKGESTVNGLLCISPFVDPKPRTLYYIPIILWCYLATPLLSRYGLRWRVYGSLSIIAVLTVACCLYSSIDNRFVFNVFFYLVGLISASYFEWKFKTPYNTTIKVIAILAFVLTVAIIIHYSKQYSTSAQLGIGAAGVFVILFSCEGITNLFFGSQNSSGHGFKAHICKIIGIVSYASMASYMFHRFFYWTAEKIWNPSDASIKWCYMIVVVYPIILALSYTIQKLYDNAVKRL